MSTEVDAREAWINAGDAFLWSMAAVICNPSSSIAERAEALNCAARHLRTTPEGYRLLRSTTHGERSFPEDATHENGNYFSTCCECGRPFMGHKRRIVCKVCANEKPIIDAHRRGNELRANGGNAN